RIGDRRHRHDRPRDAGECCRHTAPATHRTLLESSPRTLHRERRASKPNRTVPCHFLRPAPMAVGMGGSYSRHKEHTAMKKYKGFLTLKAVLTLLFFAAAPAHSGEKSRVTLLQTASGVRFGLRGDKPSSPAPTLFVFATRPEDTLGNDTYNKIGRLLAAKGWISVSLDLPCHGKDVKPKEPAGLDGWRYRVEHGDNIVR